MFKKKETGVFRWRTWASWTEGRLVGFGNAFREKFSSLIPGLSRPIGDGKAHPPRIRARNARFRPQGNKNSKVSSLSVGDGRSIQGRGSLGPSERGPPPVHPGSDKGVRCATLAPGAGEGGLGARSVSKIKIRFVISGASWVEALSSRPGIGSDLVEDGSLADECPIDTGTGSSGGRPSSDLKPSILKTPCRRRLRNAL